MLQLISNQDMEFGGLFDNPPYSAPIPTQELPSLTQSITSSAPPPPTTTVPPATSSSSILSSSPHLDALLGPPITRSSSTPDKAFQPPTFQQSPLAQVPAATQRQQLASPQQAPGLRQPKVEQPQPILSPPAPAQAASPHSSPGPNPAFSSTPQALFTSPAPQTTPPQPQTQLQAQTQPQQVRANYSSPNGFTGMHCSTAIHQGYYGISTGFNRSIKDMRCYFSYIVKEKVKLGLRLQLIPGFEAK